MQRSVATRLCSLVFFFYFAACGDSAERADVDTSADATDATDTTDATDASDTADAGDTAEASDTTTDATDTTTDASDTTTDAGDTTDASDTTTDVGDTTDVSDTADVSDDVDADDDASGPREIARATLGPAGGSLGGEGVSLVVPPGALDGEVELRLVERAASAAPFRLSPVIGLEPAGLVFEVPARARFDLPAGVTHAVIHWTHTASETAFQALPTALDGLGASAPIVHFSSIFLGDPTVPGPSGWFCCEPQDPSTHSDADCIAWSAGAGTTCDPAICTLVPGACPTDPPGAGCCAPGPTGDEPTQGCASLVTYGQCALGVGQGFCTWSAACATATPGCCAALDPQHDAQPIPCAQRGGHAACTAAGECQWNTSAACPVPPAPGAPPCADCVDPVYTSAPAFAASAQASWQLHGGLACSQLAAQPVPPPQTSPGDPGYAVELGRWCAFEAAVEQQGCSAPATVSPACTGLPSDCCFSPTGAEPPGTTCDAQKSYGACTAQGGTCLWNPACGGPPGCCEPIDPAHDHQGLGCAQMPDYGECVLSLGYGDCQWDATGDCAPGPTLCDQCTDPSVLNDPGFQSAQQSWLASHTSPTCGALGASPVAAPSAAPGTPAFYAELGPWCAYQQSLTGLGCTSPTPACPDLPTSCCFATDPADDLAQPGGCAALVSQFDCEYQVGLHFCTWNPSCGLATPKQCCVQIDPGIDEPVVGCAQMPDYGECVESLGFGYCKWDPSAGCPLPSHLSCAHCADPQIASDPDVQTAYVQSYLAYAQGGCSAVLATPVPGPATPPAVDPAAATVWETELGRFCGYEAAFAALQCTPSFTAFPACPAPPPPTTCCTSLVPGIDPPTASCAALTSYGDCTQGAGVGACQWHPSPSCAVPQHDACADCLDPQWLADPDVQTAQTQSYQAYLAGGCGLVVQAPVPAPSAPPVTTPDKTQLGRFCGYEQAAAAGQCLPTATWAPTCPGLPFPPTCCTSLVPGQNPPQAPCAALASYADCAGTNAGTCVWATSPTCPAPVNQPCADCADPTYYNQAGFQAAFVPSYTAYVANGCGLVAASPVPPPSAAVGTALHLTQLGRYCGFHEAVAAAGCGPTPGVSACPLDLCQTLPALCPAPPPTCSTCAQLAGAPGFGAAYNQSLSSVAAACLPAQVAGPPAMSAQPGQAAYAVQAGAYCGWLGGMQQHCNSPGCGGLGCAACIDPAHTQNPTFYSALHYGWTRYGAETCADLAAIAIPPPSQPAGTNAHEAQLGRWCAFQLALEANACAGPASPCAGLATCTAQSVNCVLPTPTCAACVDPQMMSNAAWQAGFAQATSALGGLSCAQAYATIPPTVTDGPASPYYPQQLGTWCGYQDQLGQKCGSLHSQCSVP